MSWMCQTRFSKRCNKWERCVKLGAEATQKGGKPGGDESQDILRRGGYVNKIPGRKWLGVFWKLRAT